MSGESNVTTGAPGSPTHHHHHRTHWHKFWKVARWVNPVGTAIKIKADKDAEKRDAEDATYQAELKGGVNQENLESETPYIDSPQARSGYKVKDIVVDGEEWWQDIPAFDNAILNAGDDWDGHVTYRKLLDHVYGPGIAPNEFKPHILLVDHDAAPVVAGMVAQPGFWKDVECELKGHKGCHQAFEEIMSHPDLTEEHETQILNIFKDIQRALTKADDKIDHKEDKALGIDK